MSTKSSSAERRYALDGSKSRNDCSYRFSSTAVIRRFGDVQSISPPIKSHFCLDMFDKNFWASNSQPLHLDDSIARAIHEISKHREVVLEQL